MITRDYWNKVVHRVRKELERSGESDRFDFVIEPGDHHIRKRIKGRAFRFFRRTEIVRESVWVPEFLLGVVDKERGSTFFVSSDSLKIMERPSFSFSLRSLFFGSRPSLPSVKSAAKTILQRLRSPRPEYKYFQPSFSGAPFAHDLPDNAEPRTEDPSS